MKKMFMVMLLISTICGCATVANAMSFLVEGDESNATVDLSECSDEELLAYYINFEGGEDYERLLIAETVLARDGEHFREMIFKTSSIMDLAWEAGIERFDEINIDIAKIAIKRYEDGDISEYTNFFFPDYRSKNVFYEMFNEDDFECLETEHYIFFKEKKDVIEETETENVIMIE